MSIHDATSVASAAAVSSASSVKKVTKSLTNTTLAKKLLQLNRKCYKCYFAKSFDQLPNDDLSDINPEIIAHYSGPDQGINDITLVPLRQQAANPPTTDVSAQQTESKESKENNPPTAAAPQPAQKTEAQLALECYDSLEKSGVNKFNVYHHRAYGIACSLYENNPNTNSTVGDPIADVFAILTRKNSCILSLADGVNWGPRSRLAARCAVRANVNFIDRNLFHHPPNSEIPPPSTTHDVFKIMCRSFDSAQELILRRKGTMTTLCCSVVVKLKETAGNFNQLWAVCTLSIGDSTAYVFNRTKGVFELTYGARNLNNDRDMRNVGGALGHVYGNKPDVSNLNYSIMYVRSDDIVFLVSDGVSDNLDPIVSQTARKQTQLPEITQQATSTLKPENKTQQSCGKKNGHKLNRCASQSHKNLNKNSLFSTAVEANRDKMDGDQEKPTSVDDQIVHLSSLPEMSPYERYMCSLAHMNEILSRNRTLNETISAQETCAVLIEHVMRLTAAKREILECGLIEAARIEDEKERIKYQACLRERAQKVRGKLDHASIVAYEVGNF